MRSKEKIKETGATFTPPKLAEFLAEIMLPHLDQTTNLRVLDPACGDGALLKAIGQLLLHNQIEGNLTGFDLDSGYIEKAALQLDDLEVESELHHQDFLQTVGSPDDAPGLFDTQGDKYDAIIANPPYVRTQILGADYAQKLAQRFNLKGRVDLYYAFLIGMTQKLRVGGILGVLTSNRYLYTKGGESIRKYLSENYDILQVIDLGDTKLFDAAVLPAIFLGRKKEPRQQTDGTSLFTKVYEEPNGKTPQEDLEDVYRVLKSEKNGCYTADNKKYNKTSGTLRYTEGSKEMWQMLTEKENEWVRLLEEGSGGKIKDFFKVRVGVKTTADKVFIKEDWSYLGSDKPESEVLRTLISQDNIERWKLNRNKNLQLLYTHYDNEGKKAVIDFKDYPNAGKYLASHREQLEGRSYVIKSKRKWFEIWVPQNPASWVLPKLVFPDISVEPRFYFDDSGSVVNGNCYWLAASSATEVQLLKLIQGVANSELMQKYHDLLFNNKLYSGRRRYFSQYVENYLVPRLDNKYSQQIIQLVNELHQQEAEANSRAQELNTLVNQAFGLK